MDFNKFLSERKPRWDELTAILDRVDKSGLRGLSAKELDEFFALYRLVSSDLNLLQTRTGNPAILEYLEGLVGRAYANLASPPNKNPFKAWWKIVRHKFPALMRKEKSLLALTTSVFMAGALLGFIFTTVAPETAEVFLPYEHLVQKPSERVAELEKAEEEGKPRISTAGEHAVFSTFLFTHNIRVTVFGFALGLTLGIGTIMILFYNGAVLGSIAALYLNDGVIRFFIGWIGPHGSIEIPCILFGCTAGLMMARAQIRRDKGSFRSQLRLIREDLVNIVIGTASLLVIAGTIEGGFSQINEPTIPYNLKIAVAAVLFISLLAYLFRMPVSQSGGKSENAQLEFSQS